MALAQSTYGYFYINSSALGVLKEYIEGLNQDLKASLAHKLIVLLSIFPMLVHI